MKKEAESSKNHYELLGVPVDASGVQIKDAYRKLQKKYHPDIAGDKVFRYLTLFSFSNFVSVYAVVISYVCRVMRAQSC